MAVRAQKKETVAVIGSGMAGLVTAYLLRQDKQRRYEVEVFETVNDPLLSSKGLARTNMK